MAKHEEKSCPRCNKSFECKCGSINVCQCSTIELADDLSQQLKETYSDCLCIQCLREIKLTRYIKIHKPNATTINNLIMNR